MRIPGILLSQASDEGVEVVGVDEVEELAQDVDRRPRQVRDPILHQLRHPRRADLSAVWSVLRSASFFLHMSTRKIITIL